MGWFKKIKKAVKKAVKQTGKVVGDVGQTGIDVVKSTGSGLVGAVSSAAKGDVIGAITNTGKFMTAGQVDLTGKKEGLINVNTKGYLAKALGAGGSGASTSTSAALAYNDIKKKKGLVTQLRQGKGAGGGGSYTTVAKNPLGGASGMTGR